MIFQWIYRVCRRLGTKVQSFFDTWCTLVRLHGNGVVFQDLRTTGVPFVSVARGAKGMQIGSHFSMHNGAAGNPIGCFHPCTFFVDMGCSLTIGENVGISSTAMIAHADITIGHHVKIGGGTCIYTSDFHSLDAVVRCSSDDLANRISKPVVISDHVFIGAHCLILKGVEIGEGSIIGAGSVVTKSVPAHQVWAGNPARFIRECR